MSLALNLAAQGRFTVSPNPMVGCVITQNNQVVGHGYHEYTGGPHAEIVALNAAKERALGATVYITLEPCCHQGRTSACTDALIKAGIKKIYVACLDPNPLMSGKGIDILRSAGIQVKIGCCENEAKQLNEIFFHFIEYKRPFVIAKWAMSLDGKTKTNKKDSKQISCIESIKHAHQIRRQVDAILIGSKTARDDNPLLTARYELNNQIIAKQPIRIILSGNNLLNINLKIFNNKLPGKTIVVVSEQTEKLFYHLKANNVELLKISANKNNYIDLHELLDALGKKEITSLLVEGGMKVHESFFTENLINKTHIYLSPNFIGKLNQKNLLQISSFSQIGKDFHFIANSKGPTNV